MESILPCRMVRSLMVCPSTLAREGDTEEQEGRKVLMCFAIVYEKSDDSSS
jgi:hypothetical protein